MDVRRSYGSGSLYQRAGSWYGRWYSNGRRVKRKLGPVRPAGTREGLTRAMAEREMRRRIEAELPTPSVAARVAVAEAGARLLVHLEGLGRKRSTMEGYESFLRVPLAPFFGDRPLAEIGPNDVEAFIAASRRNRQSVKRRSTTLVCCTASSSTPSGAAGRRATRASASRSPRPRTSTPTFASSTAPSSTPSWPPSRPMASGGSSACCTSPRR